MTSGLHALFLQENQRFSERHKAPAGYDTARIAGHINSVSERVLSLSVPPIGDISLQAEIEKSTLELVPVVSTHPDGACAREMRGIANKLLYR